MRVISFGGPEIKNGKEHGCLKKIIKKRQENLVVLHVNSEGVYMGSFLLRCAEVAVAADITVAVSILVERALREKPQTN